MRCVAEDPLSRGLVQGAVETGCRRYFRATKLVRRFSEALQLVEKVSDGATSSDSDSASSALSFTDFDRAVLSSAEEHDLLLFIEAAVAHIQGWKQSPPFYGRAFCFYAASLLQELETLHLLTCKRHPHTFDESVLIEIPQTKSCSLPVKKMYLNKLGLFSFDVASKQEVFAARTKALSHRVIRAETKHLA